MTTTVRNTAIRLSVTDGNKVKAELRDVGETGSRALKRIEDAARPTSRALMALDGVTSEVRGSMEAMGGRLGALGTGLSRLGPYGIAAAAGLAAVGGVLGKGIGEAALAEQSYRRLSAVLRATGEASGLTADQISEVADGIERSTLATAEGVQDAAAILATFRSVAGDTFTRTLTLAQDMSAVFGQDLSSSVTQLGKALEDPVTGLTALRRVGISFSASQRELIKTLVETGQTAEAQRVILDALERQVGGAGAAEAGGMIGATNRLTDAWGNLLETIGQTPAYTRVVEFALNDLAELFEKIRGGIEGPTTAERVAEATERLARAREDLARAEAGGPGAAMLGQRFDVEEQRQRVTQLEGELTALQQIEEKELAAKTAAEERAKAGQAAAAAERQAEQQAERDREAREGAAKEAAKERKAAAEDAERAAKADAKVLDELARRVQTFGDPRRQAIDQALGRLSERAGAQERAQVERLAGAFYDLGEKKKAEAEAERERQQLMEEGARITEDSLPPLARLSAEVQNLNRLQAVGAITADVHARAVGDAIAEAEERALAASEDWQAGMTRGLREYSDEALNAAEIAEDAVTGGFEGMEQALASFAATSKVEWAAMVDAMIADLMRLALRMAIIAPLARAAGGFDWSSLFGGGSAAYGTTGTGTSPAGMTSGGTNPGFLLGGVATGGAFADGQLLTAYARGGIVGGPTVFPMARGYGLMGEAGPEGVLPLKRLASGNLGVEAAPAGVTVNVYNNAGAQVSTQERREPGGRLTMDVMIDALEQQLAGRMVRPGTPLNGALRAAANPVRAR